MITYKQLLLLIEDYKSDWLEKQKKNGNLTPENEDEHKKWLEHFHKNKKLLKPEHQELHKHNLQSIKDDFAESSNKRSSDSLKKRHDAATPEEKAGAETIHNANGLHVQHIKTAEASKHYGSGTKCCTAARDGNWFNHYTKDGKLYIVHGKDDKGNPHRYTIVPHAKEYRDEADNQVGAHEITKRNPELKNVKELQGTHPALTSDENFHKHLHKLLKSHPTDTLNDERVRNHPKQINSILDDMSNETKIKERISYNKNTHPDILHHLATYKDSSDDVKVNVLKNPNTHPDTLHHLATHKDSTDYIKSDVENNPNAHPDTKEYLKTGRDKYKPTKYK